MVNVAAMIDVEDMHDAGGFIDAVYDSVGAAPRTVTACERAEQRLADTLRIDSQCRIAKLQDRGGHRLGQTLGDSPPGGGLEADVVPLPRRDGHRPVARRRASLTPRLEASALCG